MEARRGRWEGAGGKERTPWCTDHTWKNGFTGAFFSALVHLTLLTSALEASSRREALTRKGSEVAANVSLSGIS